MGLRWEGLIPALILPMILTFVLFLGPIVQAHFAVPVTASLRMYFGKSLMFGYGTNVQGETWVMAILDW